MRRLVGRGALSAVQRASTGRLLPSPFPRPRPHRPPQRRRRRRTRAIMSTKEQINPLSLILEPLIVASLLTAGCLLNRRTSAELKSAAAATPPVATTHLPFLKWAVKVPDTTRFRGTVTSRFLAYFPFLMEVWYWLLTYWVRSTYFHDSVPPVLHGITLGLPNWSCRLRFDAEGRDDPHCAGARHSDPQPRGPPRHPHRARRAALGHALALLD